MATTLRTVRACPTSALLPADHDSQRPLDARDTTRLFADRQIVAEGHGRCSPTAAERHSDKTLTTEAMDVAAIGQAVLALYLAQAGCLGIDTPEPPPTIVVRPGAHLPCPELTSNGKCSGIHRGRKVIVSYGTVSAIPHELLHDLLCQIPRDRNPYGCDPHHDSPYWQACTFPPDTETAPPPPRTADS